MDSINFSKSVSIVLNKQSSRLSEAEEKVRQFAESTTAKNVLITYIKAKSSQSIGEEYEVVKGSDMLEETIMGKTFHYSAQGFFQNNSVMAEKMHEYVHEILKSYSNRGSNGCFDGCNKTPTGAPTEPQRSLLDLYGGVGAFGIINADLFHKADRTPRPKRYIQKADLD